MTRPGDQFLVLAAQGGSGAVRPLHASTDDVRAVAVLRHRIVQLQRRAGASSRTTSSGG